MTGHKPVSELADLYQLDPVEMKDGYRAGLDGDGEPGDNRSRAYWHGWRNGRTDSDGGRTHPPDDAQRALAKALVAMLGHQGSTSIN